MILQDWWYTTLLTHQFPACPPLTSDLKVDVLIIGGGMSGISAAASMMGSGLKVALLERNILAGSSTGRSAGFLTPDSELELSQLIRRFGAKDAEEIWQVPCRGIELIKDNVKKFDIECEFQNQDSLFLGLGKSGAQDIGDEAKTRSRLNLPSRIYNETELRVIFGGDGYTSAVRYGDTYGINALQYAQGMKRCLIDTGISVFESTEVIRIENHTAFTHAGSVEADCMIIAIDKMKPAFDRRANEIFHEQTFLSISEPLSDSEVRQLFPAGDNFQCWDSNTIYSYYRLTGDRRLLLGGGSMLTTFLSHYDNVGTVIQKVVAGFKEHFPFLRNLNFIQFWPGLIDSTRDLLPIVVCDQKMPYRHFVMGCVGLPWAAFCGDFVGRAIQGKAHVDEEAYYEYFTDRRRFILPLWLEKIIGKPAVFALNNGFAKYWQVDIGKKPGFKKIDF